MFRRHTLTFPLILIAAVLLTGPAAADEQWVEVSSTAAGTEPTVEVRDVGDRIVVDLDLAGFYVEERTRAGGLFSLVTVPGCGGNGAVGSPHMPFRSVLVPVPVGPEVALRIEGSESTVALTGVTLMPEQAPVPDCGSTEPEFTIDDKAYGVDRWYPEEEARIADDVVVRGQRFLVVEVNPLSFNPVRREVSARAKMRVTVELTGDVDPVAEARKAERRNVLFPTRAELDGSVVPDAVPLGIEYLIIAADPLVGAVGPLVDWKRRKGLTVEVVPMSIVGTSAADLKTFLQNRYDTDPSLTYVLLAGDHPMVPSEDLGGGMVSDLYLSCLDGSDYFPDVVMGRIAVQTVTDCENVVDKILTFERDTVPGSWHGDYLMAAYLQDSDDSNCRADRYFFETGTHAMHYIRDQVGMGAHTAATSGNLSCSPYNWREDATWFPHRPPGYVNQSVPPADAALITNGSTATQDITDAINAGVSLVQHRDHGGETGWGDPSFYNSHVSALSNGAMTPIVYSVNCLTGTFNMSGDCFAETFMKKYPGGAVGVIAATEVSYSGHNDLLVHGAYDSFWDDYDTADGGNIYPHSFRPAEAYLYGKYYMYHWQGDGSTTQLEFELFHWHGDPEMRVFTAVPTTPGVTVEPTIPVGGSTLSVSVDVEGALVAVTDDGVLLGRGFASGGSALVDLTPPPDSPTTLQVVVSGQNLVPWQGTTEVITPAGPWMIHRGHVCDDSAGNGDGIANPGETIRLPVAIENIGADDGSGITGVLVSGSAHAVVSDPSAVFPDAAVGVQVQSLPDHFALLIGAGAPNGHLANMSLDWSATGGHSGTTLFAVPVCEPLLISDVTVDFVGNASAVVNWTTNVPASTQLTYGVTAPTTVVDEAGPTTSHEVEIGGLDPCTAYVFEVASTSPDCYSAADDNGGALFPFTTTAGTSVDFDATDTPVAIPDNNATGASSMITVVSPYDVVDVDLLVNITHTYTGDLRLFLIGPDGTSVLLSDRHGSSGDNFTDTHFDDEAAVPVSGGSAPFTGSFQPDSPLALLDGQPAAGVWTFKVVDNAGMDIGNIVDWQLQLTVNEPCGPSGTIFSDGFEAGDATAWSDTVP